MRLGKDIDGLEKLRKGRKGLVRLGHRHPLKATLLTSPDVSFLSHALFIHILVRPGPWSSTDLSVPSPDLCRLQQLSPPLP